MGLGLILQNRVQSELRRRLIKAASELGLHYFLCRINTTAAMKGFNLFSASGDI